MNIQINNNYGIILPNKNASPTKGYFSNINLGHSLQSDCFEISKPEVSFCGKKVNKKEEKRIEQTLKNIDGLHDPYSDVVMISAKKFKHFQAKIRHRHSSESMIGILSDYTKHMFDSETEVFELIKKETSKAKKEGRAITFSDILQDNYPEAKVRLINAQLNVIDDIRELSRKKLKKDDKEYVDLYLTIIEKDIYNDHFRIKSSRELLRRLENELNDKNTAKEIIKLTKKFPNTSTNSDAFIVKNYDKTSEEIAELLISPAQISIEHIKPSSLKGESKASNYLAASKRMNNYRSSLPLEELIEEYPNIPSCTQRYFDDLITKINRGGLNDVATTIPDVKKSLYEESNGIIDVDISELKPEIIDKSEQIKTQMDKLKAHFNNK